MTSQRRLKELLDYDQDSGVFIWKVHRNGRTTVGSIAGTIKDKHGYVSIKVEGKKQLAHRLAWVYMTGEEPAGVDHRNRIRTDNRWINLRELNQSDNCKNKIISSANTSGVAGVSFDKKSKRWITRINVDLKRIYLGGFATFHEAVDARKNAEVLYGYTELRGD